MKAEFDPYGILVITTETNIEHFAMRKWLQGNVLPQGIMIHINIPETEKNLHEKYFGSPSWVIKDKSE